MQVFIVTSVQPHPETRVDHGAEITEIKGVYSTFEQANLMAEMHEAEDILEEETNGYDHGTEYFVAKHEVR